MRHVCPTTRLQTKPACRQPLVAPNDTLSTWLSTKTGDNCRGLSIRKLLLQGRCADFSKLGLFLRHPFKLSHAAVHPGTIHPSPSKAKRMLRATTYSSHHRRLIHFVPQTLELRERGRTAEALRGQCLEVDSNVKWISAFCQLHSVSSSGAPCLGELFLFDFPAITRGLPERHTCRGREDFQTPQ